MIFQPAFELRLQKRTHSPHVLNQVLLLDNLLHGQSCCARYRMTLIRLPMPKHSRTFLQSVDDVLADQYTGNRHVAASESLGDGLDVRNNVVLFPCVQCPAAADAGHHFVEDEECAVFSADGFHGLEIAWYGGDAA
jgi:hypothetical protein